MNKLLTGVVLGYIFHDAIDEALEWLITRGKDKPEKVSPSDSPFTPPDDEPPTIQHD